MAPGFNALVFVSFLPGRAEESVATLTLDNDAPIRIWKRVGQV